MPPFPRYQSKGQLTTQKPAVDAVANTDAQISETRAQMGQAVSENSLKWVNALDTIQKTTALANFKTGMADIQNRALNDPNYNNSEQYYSEIKKLKDDNLKGFSTKTAETEMALNFGYESQVGSIQVENIFKKKALDMGRASTLRLLDQESSNPSPNMESNISGILSAQIDKGIFSHEEGYKLEQDHIKAGRYNAFLADVNTDPALAQARLEKNEYGLDALSLDKAKKYKVALTKKNEEFRKETQLATANELAEKLVNNTLTPEDVQSPLVAGTLDAERALNYELAIAGPEEWSKFASAVEQGTKSKMITDLLEKATADDVETKLNIVNSAIQNYNDGNLNKDDMRFILRVAAGKSKEPNNPIWGQLNSAVGMAAGTQAGAKILDKFKKEWDFQSDPRFVMHETAVAQYKEDKPETAPYQIGDVIKRKSGSYEIAGFNEDGSPVFRKK